MTGERAEVVIGCGGSVVVLDEGFGTFESVPCGKDVFWASEKCLPDEEIWNSVKHNAFLMLDADVLRQNGALISKQVSWERTAADLLWQMKNNPNFSYLLGTKYIFITLGDEAGAAMHGDRPDFSAKLMLYDGKPEGDLKARYPADIPDIWTAKVAGAIKLWLFARENGSFIFERFCGGIDAVLFPAAKLREQGYDINNIKNGKSDIALALDEYAQPAVLDVPEPADRKAADPNYWCISNNFYEIKINVLAFAYVRYGKKTFQSLPKFTCGALTTVDRKEIEAFQNIKNLITEYVNLKNPKNPLSIAVFGAPGSGKSFGVKQIAKTLFKDVIEAIEINVSQLADQRDLGDAFHRVRDIVLKGKLPLVFFDEFDSDNLRWLKSFLAPMQDGEFRDESGVHPVGKCIFVFAGGTAASFDDFIKPMNSKLKEDDESALAFKNVKGPDFVSRLRGTINILGPNQTPDSDEQGFLLRRAILLRSFLEQRKLVDENGVANVSLDIITAMLLVPKYEHGARSMEAILDMSRIEGASFEPVSLPFYTQMKLHVDADAFIRLVLKGVILNGYLEELAKIIHEDFLAKQKGRKLPIDKDVDVPWAELPESYKNENRRQAKDIPEKLKAIGYAFDFGDAPYPAVESFTEEETKKMAVYEHDRWIESRKKDGWIYGEKRDNENKKHPLLVPFEKLPKEEQQKDIDAAKNIFGLLKRAGLRVYRVV
jgi:hypothetical protein